MLHFEESFAGIAGDAMNAVVNEIREFNINILFC